MKKTLKTSMVVGIPIEMIVEPQESMIRKIGIAQLAESIKAVGLINALTVKPVDGRYEIVAGRRRYWACREAGFVNINCFILEADQFGQTDVIEVTENLHRVQLTPMQEAEAIQKLRDLKHSDESIAADLGMTKQFVARRAKLLDLSPEWKKALSGKGNSQIRNWPVACLELIARYPADRQAMLYEHFEDEEYLPDLDELKRDLATQDNRLISAPWKLEDESLDPKAGACSNCPKRSGVQPLLFDIEQKGKTTIDDRCLDPECWAAKLKKHTEVALETAKAKYPDAILVSRGYSAEKGVLKIYEYKSVKKGTPKAKQAIVVDGNAPGSTLWITTTQFTDKTSLRKAKATKKEPTEKDRAQRITDRRNKWIIDTLRSSLHGKKFKLSGGIMRDWPIPTLRTAVGAAVTFGLNRPERNYYEGEKSFDNFAAVENLTDDRLGALFAEQFRSDLVRHLYCNTGIDASKIMPKLGPVFDFIGSSYSEFYAEASKVIPDKHNYLKENPPPQTPVKTESSSAATDDGPSHQINENGVFTNPQRINILLPKSLKCKATIMLARGSDGKWYHSHDFTHSNGQGGGGGLPSFNRKYGCKSREAAKLAGKESLLAQMKAHLGSTGTGEENIKRLRKAIEFVKGWTA